MARSSGCGGAEDYRPPSPDNPADAWLYRGWVIRRYGNRWGLFHDFDESAPRRTEAPWPRDESYDPRKLRDIAEAMKFQLARDDSEKELPFEFSAQGGEE